MNAGWIVLITALLSCFFGACNYALLDFSRRRLMDLLETRGLERRAVALEKYRTGLLLMTGLLRTVCNLVLLMAMVAWIAPPDVSHNWGLLVTALVLSALVIAVAGVAIPVSWSRYAAEPLLARTLPMLRGFYVVLSPLMRAMHLFDPIVRRLLGVPPTADDDATPLEQEILDAVSEGEERGLVDEDQKEMIEAVVEFPSITVDQIMTPRTEVQGIPLGATLDEIKRIFADAGHSRMPVYEDDLDHIAGVLYVKDLIPMLGSAPPGPLELRKILRDAVFVPETKTVRDLFAQFRHSNVHIAIVLDEYGGTAGLVTIEDIVEEIVGDIRDEYEKVSEEPPLIRRIDDRTWDVHARVYVDDFNDELAAQLPDEEDYDTVGGFVFATLGRIPAAGESFDYHNLRFTVTDAEKTRVNTVRVELLKPDEVGVTDTPRE